MNDKSKLGLYAKYDVKRTDGQSADGCKHEGCSYFVLDLTCDPHAVSAIRAYAESCKEECPVLASELTILVNKASIAKSKPGGPPR